MAPHPFALKILKEQLFLLVDFEIISEILGYNRLLQIVCDPQDWAAKRAQRVLFSLDQKRNQHHQQFTAFQWVTSSGQQRPRFNHRTIIIFSRDCPRQEQPLLPGSPIQRQGVVLIKKLIQTKKNQESVPVCVIHFYMILERPLRLPTRKWMRSRS